MSRAAEFIASTPVDGEGVYMGRVWIAPGITEWYPVHEDAFDFAEWDGATIIPAVIVKSGWFNEPTCVYLRLNKTQADKLRRSITPDKYGKRKLIWEWFKDDNGYWHVREHGRRKVRRDERPTGYAEWETDVDGYIEQAEAQAEREAAAAPVRESDIDHDGQTIKRRKRGKK